MCYAGGPYCYEGISKRLEKAHDKAVTKMTPAAVKSYKNALKLMDTTDEGMADLQKQITSQTIFAKSHPGFDGEVLPNVERLKQRLQAGEKRRALFEKKRAEKKAESKKTASHKTHAKTSKKIERDENGMTIPPANPLTRETSAMLKKDLKESFPTMKNMKVTMARGTAYGWLRVEYTDGPNTDELAETLHHYKTAWKATGINVHRNFSDEKTQEALSHLETNGERYIKSHGVITFPAYSHMSDEQLAHNHLRKISL